MRWRLERDSELRYGVCAISSFGHLWGRSSYHRGSSWGGRVFVEWELRAIHGTIRNDDQGPSVEGCGVAIDEHGDQRAKL